MKKPQKEFKAGAYYLAHNICPICERNFTPSEYLATVFVDQPLELFMANMVTHYRHAHITSWNKAWGRYGSNYRDKWFGDYDEEKSKVNERAKRQIIRKAHPVLRELGITAETLKNLQGTTPETLKVAEKYLSVCTQKHLFSDENTNH